MEELNMKCNKKIFRLETIHLWIFPILAIIFSTWAITNYMQKSAKTIEINFTDASSIVPDKTRVLYRGVQIGMVSDISISKDGKKVVCEVELTKSGEKFAVSGTKFYLITPKVGINQISGLDTLISGSYIVTEPNFENSEKENVFEGYTNYNETSDSAAVENMVTYYLETEHAESVSSGDSIYFRGIEVGKIGEANLSTDSRSVILTALIQKKYIKLIRTNTVFWKKEGIKADLGLFGSDIKINALDTIMKGGVELATPNRAGPIANLQTKFTLLDQEPEEREDNKWNPKLQFPKKNRLSVVQ